MVVTVIMMPEAPSQYCFLRGLRREKAKWDSETKAVARQTGGCGSGQAVVLCCIAGSSWAGGVRRLVDALLTQ